MAYRPTIGLEVHAELATRTKMFCDSANDPDEKRPNANVCPVCMAHPGTLPVINKEAVRHILRIGTAVGGTLADYSEFDRKSYFYPDIPKGYQISQYEHPLVKGGELAGVALTRVHLEEDTARSSHEGGSSLVDFNRAGVPLMELVTEPVVHDAATAGKFARELQLLLRTLGVGEANLEKGEMRIEANVSVSATDTPSKAYVEIKNINSFRAVERAIEFEIERQTALLSAGGTLVKETRGWDEDRGVTFSQRLKEGSADYRYFPEPDLPKLFLSELSEFSVETLRASLPELPWERRARYLALGLKQEEAEILLNDLALRALFEGAVAHAKENEKFIRLVGNYVISDVLGLVRAEVEGAIRNIDTASFAALMRMLAADELSSRGAKDVLAVMYKEGGEPGAIADREGLRQVSDEGALRAAVQGVIAENQKAVEEYRGGKEASLQYLIGQSMKATKGAGNPGVLRTILLDELKK